MSTEPILRAEDHRAWDGWMRAARIHRRTRQYVRVVDTAKRVAAEALEKGVAPSVSYSGGKDSTALTHLVCVELGAAPRVVVHSEKDDLDYPGEEAYVREHATAWGLRLNILRPPTSPVEWIAKRAARMSGDDDVHGRTAGLSKACFYGVMEAADREHDVSFLGLRMEESGVRKILLASRGLLYQLKSGLWRCNPLGHWRGIDVYAYLDQHGIEPLSVYRCVGWLPEHRQNPALIRKSWWLPGIHARHGQTAWLRHYYPSLYERYRSWFPDAASFT